jgi:hypothetical protein
MRVVHSTIETLVHWLHYIPIKAWSCTISSGVVYLTEITQPCIHMCDGLFICQLYLLPDLLEGTDCKEDTPLTLPFALFVPSHS